jgi:hypothetical protein
MRPGPKDVERQLSGVEVGKPKDRNRWILLKNASGALLGTLAGVVEAFPRVAIVDPGSI